MKKQVIIAAAAIMAAGFSSTASADMNAKYMANCFACHGTGAAGAPKMGDKAAWKARIAQGKETLYTNSIKGKGAMPAKGGRPNLSDDEVKALVDFMVSKSQ